MSQSFSPADAAHLRSVAHRLADAAAAITLAAFRRPGLRADNKATTGFDPVTEADRAAEAAMRAILDAERPMDAILGEEYGPKPGTSGLTWVLDPIDGTRGFISGPPTWGTLIAVTDGLKGMPEALAAVFPATTLQTCIVHLIRNSLDFASWKDRKPLAAAIKPIYTAVSAEMAEAELHAFADGPWGQKFPTVVNAWRRAWDKVIPFFAFPPEVRRVIYTTNAIESVNARLRKIIKTRGHFPSDDAATKLIWLALRNITEEWGRAANNWKSAMNQFAILYEDRFTKSST